MLISIVVPAYNEARGLGASLASIRRALTAFHARGWRTEIIVCDNNSTDETACVARKAGATVVFEAVNQIARARNAGARAASGTWLVFVDADSHPSEALLADVARAIADGRIVAGGATLTMGPAPVAARVAVRAWNLVSRVNRWGAGSFVFCSAELFRSLGGFSGDLFAAEEIEFFRRVKRAARASGGRVLILARHPLLTSDRRARLYTWRELAPLAWRFVRAGRRALRSPAVCAVWYDGRRE
ncbi:MAG: glycosyltransferase [Vicinamibacterales bacterium]